MAGRNLLADEPTAAPAAVAPAAGRNLLSGEDLMKARMTGLPTEIANIPVVGPTAQAGMSVLDFLNAGGGLSKEQEKKGWERGVLLPMAKNPETGELTWAVPGILQGTYEGAKQAVELPRDVYMGKYPIRPGQSVSSWMEENPELAGQALNAATFMTPGVPKGTEIFAPETAAIRRSIAAAQNVSKQTGIPFTRGQMESMATEILRKSGIEPTPSQIGELTKQLAAEQSLKLGGGEAPNIMARFTEAQKGAVNNFVDTVSKNFPDVQDLAVVPTTLKKTVETLQNEAETLYNVAGDGGIRVNSKAVETLPDYIDTRLSDPRLTIVLDESITPTALAAIRTIKNKAAALGGENARMDQLENIRKTLGGLSGVSATDASALRDVKRFYDDWIDEVERQILYTGDEKAFDALKAARGKAGEYLEIISPRKPTPANEIVAKMAIDNATPEQVASFIFGAHDVAIPGLNAPDVARRLKTVLGEKSDAWQAVRSSLWNKLSVDQATGDIYQPERLLKRLQTFLNARGVSLSKAVFSEEEIKQMRTLEQALKVATQKPPPGFPAKEPLLSKAGVKALTFITTLATTGNLGSAAMASSIPVFQDIARNLAAKAATSGKAELPKAFGTGVLGSTITEGAKAALRPETGLLRSAGQNVQDVTNMLDYLNSIGQLPGQAPAAQPAVKYNPDGSVSYSS